MKSKLIGIRDVAALLGWSASKVRQQCIEKRNPDSRLRPVQKNRPWLWNLEEVWSFAEEEAHEKWAIQRAIYKLIAEYEESEDK